MYALFFSISYFLRCGNKFYIWILQPDT